jgi:hypothetical protein
MHSRRPGTAAARGAIVAAMPATARHKAASTSTAYLPNNRFRPSMRMEDNKDEPLFYRRETEISHLVGRHPKKPEHGARKTENLEEIPQDQLRG